MRLYEGLCSALKDGEVTLRTCRGDISDTKLFATRDQYRTLNTTRVAKRTLPHEVLQVSGPGLLAFCTDPSNLAELAYLAIDLIAARRKNPDNPYLPFSLLSQPLLHVDVDTDALAQQYPPEPHIVGNLAAFGITELCVGDQTVDISALPKLSYRYDGWVPGLSDLDLRWNLSLCDAFGGFVGYPGYEWPSTPDVLQDAVAFHAGNALLGTRSQLNRYLPHLAAADQRSLARTIDDLLRPQRREYYRVYGGWPVPAQHRVRFYQNLRRIDAVRQNP